MSLNIANAMNIIFETKYELANNDFINKSVQVKYRFRSRIIEIQKEKLVIKIGRFLTFGPHKIKKQTVKLLFIFQKIHL
jgi:hypothetical protein